MARLFDVIVLGAGVQGSSTAYYLARKAGVKEVLLLEQVSSFICAWLMGQAWHADGKYGYTQHLIISLMIGAQL